MHPRRRSSARSDTTSQQVPASSAVAHLALAGTPPSSSPPPHSPPRPPRPGRKWWARKTLPTAFSGAEHVLDCDGKALGARQQGAGKSLPQRYPPRSSLGRLRCGARGRSAGTAPQRTEDGSACLGRAHGRPAATVERGGFSDATWTQSVCHGCLVGHGVWRRGHTGRRRGFGSDVRGVVRRRRGLVKRAIERDGLLRCLVWIANVRGRRGDVRRRGRGGADAADDGDARYGCRCPLAASRRGGDPMQQ